MVRTLFAAFGAAAILFASPASATWESMGGGGGSSSSGGHTHYCGCGHKGWTAKDCHGQSSSGGSSTGSSGSSGGGSSLGGSTGGGSGGTPVPEPADFALFAAGVIGLMVGRRGSRTRR